MKLMLKCCLFVFGVFVSINAGAKDIPYDTESGIRIYVSDGKISTFTETSAGDSYLPNSQVLVGKKQGKFIALGGVFGIAAEKETVKKRAQNASESIYQYFDGVVTEKLQKETASLSQVSVVGKEGDFQFKLVPSARFELNKAKKAVLSLRLSSRYKYNKKKVLRDFYYSPSDGAFSLTGESDAWFSSEGRFEAEKQKGFDLLVKAFLFDAQGGGFNSKYRILEEDFLASEMDEKAYKSLCVKRL